MSRQGSWDLTIRWAQNRVHQKSERLADGTYVATCCCVVSRVLRSARGKSAVCLTAFGRFRGRHTGTNSKHLTNSAVIQC